ncbi:uncharacterized protein MAM_03590 [Metarhizium album ARSEF 1941]|uniref:Uncharacterized protein n=1 Tax=Metarhizium album (strain ARSEF 1941) TaxID=1081103 RepID=A0A0B2WQX7_METAS|nr:uncharacterized protein MAM_03590 [Metarhizium album ARSEF 1941]KHN98466.1 hypothetical protein MAM_03590 [Metarhizium album ARSEF 1941]
MKIHRQVLLAFALAAAAQQTSPHPTMQPPLHTFPPVVDTTGSASASAAGTSATSASGSRSAAATGSTRASTGLAVPTGQVKIAPVLGIAAAAAVLAL